MPNCARRGLKKDLRLTRFGDVRYNVLRPQKSPGQITIGAGSKALGLTRFGELKYNVLRPQNELGENSDRRGVERARSNSLRGGKI